MDPDENLKQQIELAEGLLDESDSRSAEDRAEDGAALAALVLSLDEWIKKRGFLPKRWGKGR